MSHTTDMTYIELS